MSTPGHLLMKPDSNLRKRMLLFRIILIYLGLHAIRPSLLVEVVRDFPAQGARTQCLGCDPLVP